MLFFLGGGGGVQEILICHKYPTTFSDKTLGRFIIYIAKFMGGTAGPAP